MVVCGWRATAALDVCVEVVVQTKEISFFSTALDLVTLQVYQNSKQKSIETRFQMHGLCSHGDGVSDRARKQSQHPAAIGTSLELRVLSSLSI